MLDALPVFSAGQAQAARRDLVDARLASSIELTIGRPLAQFTSGVVEPSGHEKTSARRVRIQMVHVCPVVENLHNTTLPRGSGDQVNRSTAKSR